MYYYSPSKNAIYHGETMQEAGKEMPVDASPISDELHSILRQGVIDGKIFKPNEQGIPTLYDREPERPPVPGYVTMYQARAALIMAGLDDDVESAINGLPDGSEKKLTRTAWEYAQVVERHSTFTLSLATALGLTSNQVDDLFIAASQVQ